jgi:hypothetical protein
MSESASITASNAKTKDQVAETARQRERRALHDRSTELTENNDALTTRLAAEAEMIKARREHGFKDTAYGKDLPNAGLALSGGGVRSATFCLGLIQGLARNRVLRRFDYMSTVSGGGYVGSSVGRLVAREGIDEAERMLASGDSQVLGWLRKNGRYLTPSGARDIGMAIATLLRSSISTHFELGLLALLLGVLVILPHAVQTQFVIFDESAWASWKSVWWPIALALWVFAAPGCIWAFWPLRDPEKDATGRLVERTIDFALALAALIVSGIVVSGSYKAAHGWVAGVEIAQLWLLASAGAVAWIVYASVQVMRLRGVAEADAIFGVGQLRNRLTRALRWINTTAAALLLLGVLDWLTYEFVPKAQDSSWWTAVFAAAIGVGGAVVMAMRSAAEPLQKAFASSTRDRGRTVSQLINAIGMAIGFLLLFAWTALLQWLVFYDADANILFHGIAPLWAAFVVLVGIATWTFFTRRHHEALNGSSLHGFYRARLIRAYVSLGNINRFPDIKKPFLGVIEANTQSVVDVIEGDDVPLKSYRPESKGGPIHLVGTTLNQTIDDHGDLYNADRKGICAIVSAMGVEIGSAEAGDWANDGAAATLGQWVTISGAAAAPGAGSNTTSGWALLLYLFGIRLGYWIPSMLAIPSARAEATDGASTRGRVGDTKSGLVLSEALAKFVGRPSSWWYMSDGGHFENTGVYALLKRDVPFILLADCGADSAYTLEDVENLIRKARIDFDAEIELCTGQDAENLFGRFNAELKVLSSEQLIDAHTQRGVVLARICYHRSDLKLRKFGTLLIVKPNLHEALDKDILAYARRNPSFPQQSTADQFFDEAQWESYRRLGEDFGLALTDSWLTDLPGWSTGSKPWPMTIPLRRQPGRVTVPRARRDTPTWRRGAAAAAIGTTISLSVITSVAGVAWSIYDGIYKEREARRTAAAKYVDDAKSNFAALQPSLCAVEIARGTSACMDMPIVASAVELNLADQDKLKKAFEATRNHDHQEDLITIQTEILDLQRTCGITNGECTEAQPPSVCSKVCNPHTDNNATYWGISGKSYTADDNHPLHFLADVYAHIFGPLPMKSQTTRETRELTSSTTSDADAEYHAASVDSTPDVDVKSGRPVDHISRGPPSSDFGDTSKVAVDTTHSRPGADATGSSNTARVHRLDPLRACIDDKVPVSVYIQIYDEPMRTSAQKIVDTLHTAGAIFPGIENVASSAAARGGRAPIPWGAPTLLVHRPDQDMQCANDLKSSIDVTIAGIYGSQASLQIRDLPASFKSTRHVLELWLPSVTSSQRQ